MPKTLKLNCDSSAGQTVKNLTGLNGATGTPAASYAVTLSSPFDGSGTISVGDDLVGRFVGRLVSSADELLSRAYWDVADNAWAAGSESELDQIARIDSTISSRLADADYTAPDNAGIGAAATNAATAAIDAAATRKLGEADESIELVSGVYKHFKRERGTSTDLRPAKTVKKLDGTNLTNPTTDQIGRFVEE